MAKKLSRRTRGKFTPLPAPSLTLESPVGLAIIHTDALLEGIRKRRIREIPNVPKWFARLTLDQRMRYQRCFRQTFVDMKTASGGLDEDFAFAYAHYPLDALRTACAFFGQFVFDKSYEAQQARPSKRKKVKAKSAKTAPKQTRLDIFGPPEQIPRKKPAKTKAAKKTVTKKRTLESERSAAVSKKRASKLPVKKAATKQRKK